MLATITSAALQGIDAEIVHVEVNAGEAGEPKLINVVTKTPKQPQFLPVARNPRRNWKHSDCVYHLQDLHPTRPVYLWCRASGREQKRRGTLLDQCTALQRNVTSLGFQVAGMKAVQCCGTWQHMRELETAAAEAGQLGAILVSETFCRLVRSIEYRSTAPVEPFDEECFRMVWATRLAPCVATFQHPDATIGEQRSVQTKRGQAERQARGGRPLNPLPGEKKLRREALRDWVLHLHHVDMLSYRAIESFTGVPFSTVKDWCLLAAHQKMP